MKNKNFLITLLISIVFLTSCGGGGGSAPVSSSNNVSYAFTGVAVDPYIQGAKFFIDKNNDGKYNDGEPLSSASDANGVFGFTETATNGDKIKMHPDNKGNHGGEAYTGELLEIVFNPEKLQDNKTVVSPMTTLKNILNMTEEELVSLINKSFDQTLISEADIYIDPIKKLEENDFSAIQSNISVALLLNGLKDSNLIKNSIKDLDSELKENELYKILRPVAHSIKESLNNTKWTTVKEQLQDEEFPEPNVQSFVYSAIQSNSHFTDDISTAIENGLDDDVTTMCDSLKVIMTSKIDQAKDEILKYAFKKYLDENESTLIDNNIYDQIKTNASTLTGDFDFFDNGITVMPDIGTSEIFVYESNFVMQPYIKDAVFYIDADNDGEYDGGEDSEEHLSSMTDEKGQFYFDDPVYEGQTIRMHQYAKGEHDGLEHQGEEFERVITTDLFDGELVISPTTTVLSKYELEPEDLVDVLNTVFADTSLFTTDDIYSDAMAAFSGKDTVETIVMSKLCSSEAVSAVLEIFSQNDEFTTFINSLTLADKKTFLINILTPVVQKLQLVMDQDLLQEIYDNIILVAQPDLILSPFYSYDFDVWPDFDLNELLKITKRYNRFLVNTISDGLSAVDLTAEPSVVSTQIVNIFTNQISAITLLETTQKTTDLLLLTFIKENYYVFYEEGYLDTAKQVFTLMGSQADFSTLLNNVDATSVINIDESGLITVEPSD